MSNLSKIVYLSDADYQTLKNNGTITKNNRTITFNNNDLYLTPEADHCLFYESFLAFPQTGQTNTLYVDESNGALFYYDSTNGYTQLYVPIYSPIGGVTAWNSGTPTTITFSEQSPTLRITNGTAPTLTYTTMNALVGLQQVHEVTAAIPNGVGLPRAEEGEF